MYQEFMIGGEEYHLDERAPYSAVEKLFNKETEVAGLCELLGVCREELVTLAWTDYRDLAKEVAARIFPFGD